MKKPGFFPLLLAYLEKLPPYEKPDLKRSHFTFKTFTYETQIQPRQTSLF